MVDGDVFRMSEAAEGCSCCSQADQQACKERCYATAAQQHAADASAAEQEALVAAAEEAAIATRQRSCSHLWMTRPIRTKMRATTTILTTMMTHL